MNHHIKLKHLPITLFGSEPKDSGVKINTVICGPGGFRFSNYLFQIQIFFVILGITLIFKR